MRPTIRRVRRIATFPAATLRVLDLVEDPSTKVEQLTKVIAVDPALSLRILKVANSSIHGLEGKVDSLERAVIMLGFEAVKNISVAASLIGLFPIPTFRSCFSAQEFWSHAMAVATASKLVNDRVDAVPADHAFLAGLIHDIGHLILAQSHGEKFVRLLDMLDFDDEGSPSHEMRDIEYDIFGADHCDFGAALCESWRLPARYALVAGHHHDPAGVYIYSPLPCVVYVADRLACRTAHGFRGDVVDTTVDPAVTGMLGLKDDDLREISNELESVLPQLCSILP